MDAFRTLLALGFFLVLGLPAAEADEYSAILDKLELCVGCHGEKGAATDTKYPILAGQHRYYLYVPLKDFQPGSLTAEGNTALAAHRHMAAPQTLAPFCHE